MDTVIKILGFAFIAYVLWYILQPRPVFAIRITADGPKPTVGQVPGWFLEEVDELCRDENLQSGTIQGFPKGKRTSLQFSRQIPPGLQQRMRNLWNLPR